VFTAQYTLSPYIKQICFVFQGLNILFPSEHKTVDKLSNSEFNMLSSEPLEITWIIKVLKLCSIISESLQKMTAAFYILRRSDIRISHFWSEVAVCIEIILAPKMPYILNKINCKS
jgi:hypothetical protein